MQDRPDELTLRLLAMLATGATSAETADSCNVSLSTLARRLQSLREHWGLENNTQLLVEAIRRGLI